MISVMELDSFFEPKSVAVVGASSREGRPGHTLVRNLATLGFENPVYPVNPEASEIMGLQTYPSIESIPHEVDLAVSLASPENTIDLIEQCGKKGVKGLIILSGGFSEGGNNGKVLEEEMVKKAREYGIRVMGPNIMGPINTANRFVIDMSDPGELIYGPAAFVCQTGQFVSRGLDWINSGARLGVSKAIDLGNKADIDDADMLDYLEKDPHTKVIAIHIEGLKNARAFMETARRVSRTKPIIVYKTGRTATGAEAMASHTGSLAGNDVILDAALKAAGVIRAWTWEELVDYAKAFAFASIPQGRRLGIVTATGGAAAMAADACGDYGLSVAELSEPTLKKIRDMNPPWAKISNPIDISTTAGIHGFTGAGKAAIEAMGEDAEVDAFIGIFAATNIGPSIYTTGWEELAKSFNDQGKSTVSWIVGQTDRYLEGAAIFEKAGIPVYPSPERAVKAMAAMCAYRDWLAEDCT